MDSEAEARSEVVLGWVAGAVVEEEEQEAAVRSFNSDRMRGRVLLARLSSSRAHREGREGREDRDSSSSLPQQAGVGTGDSHALLRPHLPPPPSRKQPRAPTAANRNNRQVKSPSPRCPSSAVHPSLLLPHSSRRLPPLFSSVLLFPRTI